MQILTPIDHVWVLFTEVGAQTLWSLLNDVGENILLERKGDKRKYQIGYADHCSIDAQSPKEATEEPGQALMAPEVKNARRKITTR